VVSGGPVKVLYLAPELVVRGSTAPYRDDPQTIG